jgi:tyrosine-protein phosphatase
MDYEKALKGASSPTDSDRASSIAEEEAEWSRRRQALEDQPEEEDPNSAVAREAAALDQAMIDRLENRRGSVGSIGSTSSAPPSATLLIGAVPPFKRRMGAVTRRRHGSKASISSIRSVASVISEDLVEEDEEAEVLGLGSAYDTGSRSPSVEESPVEGAKAFEFTPRTARPNRLNFQPPMSAGPSKLSFGLPSAPSFKTDFSFPAPPKTAIRASFDLDSTPRPKTKRRPLPPVPSSPNPTQQSIEQAAPAPEPVNAPATIQLAVPPPRRTRTKSSQPTPPPLFLRTLTNQQTRGAVPPSSGPSQTLFVFPPSPQDMSTPSRTPSTMTLMSNLQQIPFPTVASPRVATEKRHGRTRSYVTLGVPPTPTTACSRVDARGWFGQDS